MCRSSQYQDKGNGFYRYLHYLVEIFFEEIFQGIS